MDSFKNASACSFRQIKPGATGTKHDAVSHLDNGGRHFLGTLMNAMKLTNKDALLIVDVQNDFVSGGNLAVPNGDEVVPVLNHVIALFLHQSLPIFATRDWHPVNHCSFKSQNGTWPPHCIAGSSGAAFAALLNLPQTTIIVSKATTAENDAYSGFDGTDLDRQLRSQGIERLFIGGLATDYCVLNTVKDALSRGFNVVLLLDAIRAVDLRAGDGQAAISEMIERGAEPLRLSRCDYLSNDCIPEPVAHASLRRNLS